MESISIECTLTYIMYVGTEYTFTLTYGAHAPDIDARTCNVPGNTSYFLLVVQVLVSQVTSKFDLDGIDSEGSAPRQSAVSSTQLPVLGP